MPTRCRVNVGLAPSMSTHLFINESLCPVMNAHRCRVWFCTGLGMACRECLYVGFPWIRGVCWDYVAIPAIPYFGISLSLSVLASRWPGANGEIGIPHNDHDIYGTFSATYWCSLEQVLLTSTTVLRPAASVLLLILPKFPWLPCVSLTVTTPFWRSMVHSRAIGGPSWRTSTSQTRQGTSAIESSLEAHLLQENCDLQHSCRSLWFQADFDHVGSLKNSNHFLISMLSRPEKWPEGVSTFH